MIKRLVFLIAVLFAAPVCAQSVQQGTTKVTSHHGAMWLTNGVIGDAGGAAGGPAGTGLSELGITATGLPFCINDAPTTGAYHQFCLGANSLGGALLSYQAIGGATQLSMQCNINGTVYPCFPSGGNVTGPGSSVSYNLATYNGSTGALLRDSGIAAQSAAPPTAYVGWLNTANVLSKNPYGYLGTFGLLQASNKYGEMGVVGSSETIDTPLPNVCCSIGVAAVNINNNTVTPQGSWIYYGTGSRLSGTGSLVSEIDEANFGTLVHEGSYLGNQDGQVSDLALQCGGEPIISYGLTGTNCSAALVVRGNGDTFERGIVIGNLSISGTNAIAMEMASGQTLAWVYDNTEVPGFLISSFVNTAADAQYLQVTNSGLGFLNASGKVMAAIALSTSTTAGYVVLGENGADGLITIGTGNGASNSNLELSAIGSGNIVFNSTTKFSSSTTGSGTQTFTNSPCATSLTQEQWIPVTISGQSGTFYVPACH